MVLLCLFARHPSVRSCPTPSPGGPAPISPSPPGRGTSARSTCWSSPPGGVHLIEPKDWHGSVTTENGTWVQTTPNGRRVPHGNPHHLADKKAKELASPGQVWQTRLGRRGQIRDCAPRTAGGSDRRHPPGGLRESQGHFDGACPPAASRQPLTVRLHSSRCAEQGPPRGNDMPVSDYLGALLAGAVA
ncbi:nuclease-related domain-containing protein [Nonomuraea sp. NPDC052116]|uniref:nuclease-related domain-containing protein n=1 Tax=Nonomuraea sp. NPDC052116 TaxID=3155665 RepID=UPI003443E5F6